MYISLLGIKSNNEYKQPLSLSYRVHRRKRHQVMRKHVRFFSIPAAIMAGAVLFLGSAVFGQESTERSIAARLPSSESVAASVPRTVEVPSALSETLLTGSTKSEPTKPETHPLIPVLRWAKQGLPAIENLKDYSATLVRRERVNGRLSGYEYVFVKIRHQPFSVYVYFLAPASVKGQEVIYIAGQNQGNLLAHKANMSVTVSLHPEGMVAMTGRNYPLTEIGLVNLVRRLVEVGQQDLQYGDCEVKYFTSAKVNKRPCTVIQVMHPTQRDVFRFHLARIFVDNELMTPIRYESYDWPREPGGEPELLEEYTYMDLKVNVGFTDEDFSVQNPEYRFHQTTAKR